MKGNGSSNNWGCWISVLILIYFVICGIKGCITRSNNKGTTCVNVIDSNKNVSQIRIKDTAFIGKDTIYISMSGRPLSQNWNILTQEGVLRIVLLWEC